MTATAGKMIIIGVDYGAMNCEVMTLEKLPEDARYYGTFEHRTGFYDVYYSMNGTDYAVPHTY